MAVVLTALGLFVSFFEHLSTLWSTSGSFTFSMALADMVH
jgi:hypothetical protein